ncbi:hypothetical protein ACWEQL_04200 [Kitasatospora sp. NPDC004240]
MSQRRSYPNSGDFNLDDLFRPEPGQQPSNPARPPQGPPPQAPPYGQSPQPAQPAYGQPQYADPQPYGEQQTFGEVQGFDGPGYGQPAGQPYPPQPHGGPEHAADTQYLPPYPTADPGQQAPPPQPAGAYPGFQDYPTAAVPAQGPPPVPPVAPVPQVGGRPGGGRSSNKLIIGGVVAGCAAGAILVAFLMSGGDDEKGQDKKPAAAPVVTGTPGAGPSATASGPATVSPETKTQAQALSELLGTANDSRQAVIGAVAAVQKCDKLPESQQALAAAAGQRKDLQAKLAQLKTDKLPSGQQLVEQLNQAWQASATADEEYAAWAADAQTACEPKKSDNPHYKNAVAASGTATTAKKQASALWNAIAGQTGLPTKSDGDL